MVANQALYDILERVKVMLLEKEAKERLSSCEESVTDQPIDVQVAVAYGEYQPKG